MQTPILNLDDLTVETFAPSAASGDVVVGDVETGCVSGCETGCGFDGTFC